MGVKQIDNIIRDLWLPWIGIIIGGNIASFFGDISFETTGPVTFGIIMGSVVGWMHREG